MILLVDGVAFDLFDWFSFTFSGENMSLFIDNRALQTEKKREGGVEREKAFSISHTK